MASASLLVAVALAGGASGASGASSYGDPQGDDSAAPDITSVTVSESDDVLGVVVDVGNYETLPPESRLNLWFDVDGDTATGDSTGDDALVRFTSDGAVELRRWEGEAFAAVHAPGLTARYQDGRLSVAVPIEALGPLTSPGILVVGARSSMVGGETLTTADFAPENGRSRWLRNARSVFADFDGDQDAAPDITAIRVNDQRNGWIRFAISTPNRVRLPDTSLVAVAIDRDESSASGDRGTDVLVTTEGGEVRLERWDERQRRWLDDRAPTRVHARSARGVVTIDVHRSELDDARRFGFRVFAADRRPLTGALVAVDFAPDSGGFWRYSLANVAVAGLVAGKAVGVPASPRAGKAFAIAAQVRRSDTNRAISSGTVRCDVRADAVRIRAAGRVRAGAGRCELLVPPGSKRISGSMTIRSGGRTVTAHFRFRVG